MLGPGEVIYDHAGHGIKLVMRTGIEAALLSSGARGAGREACELILKSTDGWSQVTARYF